MRRTLRTLSVAGGILVVSLPAATASATAASAPSPATPPGPHLTGGDQRWFTGIRGPAIRAGARAQGGARARALTAKRAAASARRFLDREARWLGLTSVTLSHRVQVIPWRGHRVIRFAQRHEGLPVFGRGVRVRVDAAGRVRTVATAVRPDLRVVPVAVVSAAEAYAASLAHWEAHRMGHPETVLGIWVPGPTGPTPSRGRAGAEGVLVWRVDGNLSAGRTRTLVDAVSGVVLRAGSRARSASAPGRVFAQNPVATPDPVVRSLANLTDASALEGRAGAVWRYVSGSLEDPASLELEHRAANDGSGFLYDPVLDGVAYDDAFAEVNLYYHLDRVDSYFRDVHGHVPTRTLRVVANYTEAPGTPYNNAFSTQLSPSEHGLFFGQGSAKDFAYDGDVVYHEFTHYVIDEVTQMGYLETLFDEQGMHFGPGGLHEGLADYFAASLTDEPVTGEYSLGTRARDLRNDLRCPDDVFGEPHEDGRIIGGVTWEIRAALDASDLADDLIFGALTMLSSLATWQDFNTALLDTAALMRDAGDLTQADVDAVGAVLRARGLDICGRILTLEPGQPRTTRPFGFDWLARIANSDCETVRVLGVRLPGAFQYRVEVPPEARTLRLRIRHAPGDRLLYWVVLRREEPVGFSVTPVVQGLSVVFPADFDHELGEYEGDDQTIELTTEDAEPLVPGTTYYVAFLHQNCPDSEVIIQAEVSTELPAGDAGPGDDEPRAGCGCAARRAGGAPARVPAPWLWLILAWLWRRRAR